MSYSAIKTDSSGVEIGSQFPEHYSLQDLQDIRANMPAHKWAREYMCVPLNEETATFPPAVLLRAKQLWKELKPAYDDPKNLIVRYIGQDVAVSEAQGADWSVFSVLEKIDGKPLFLRDIVRKHLNTKENEAELERLYHAYHPHRILVEKTGVGWGVAEAATKHPVYGGIARDFDTKMASREKILSRLEVYMRNGKLAIPENTILETELSQMSYKQGRDGRNTYESLGEHDDTVMATAVALEAAFSSASVSLAFI
jgi:hypothetical protein